MEQITSVKTGVLATVGLSFGWVCNLLGGGDAVLKFLLLLMLVDYLTGLAIAIIFKKSPKTETGAANSTIGFKGICKKVMMLFMVLIAYKADVMLGLDYIRSSTILAFIINELVSLVENAGLMGVKIPKVILNLIDVLKAKEEKDKTKIEENIN